MRQRKFEIVINENIERDDAVKATVSMRIGRTDGCCMVYEHKSENAELTEDQIAEAVSMLLSYFLPDVPAQEVAATKKGVVFKRTTDGKFVPA